MRALRYAVVVAACSCADDWRWMLAISVVSGLLTYLFGVSGYFAALTIAILWRARIRAALPRRKTNSPQT